MSVSPSLCPRRAGLLSVLPIFQACAERRAFALLLPEPGILPPSCFSSHHLLKRPFPATLAKTAPPHLPPSCTQQILTVPGMPHLPYDLLLPSQQFHNLKQLRSAVLLSVPTESQLREGRNFSTFQSLLHPQCPAPWLAHSRCSIAISKKAGRKKRRHKKDGGASGPSPSIHTEAQNLFPSTLHAERVYIINRKRSKEHHAKSRRLCLAHDRCVLEPRTE